MHWIKNGKLVFRIEKTGEEYAIPVTKEACLAYLTKETGFGKLRMEALFNLAALKKWGDEYVEFHRDFYSGQVRQLAKEFMKARNIKEGEATARAFFELALPELEKSGSFLFPEDEQNIELLEMNDQKVHARIWACPQYAAWKKAGISDDECLQLCKLGCWASLDIGKENSENWDEAFAKILNPKLQYRVHQCLPQGKKYCEITQEIKE